MNAKDKHWLNTKDRYYTLKPTRKKLYINEFAIENITNYPIAIHLMFPEDKIKEEYFYNEEDPISSLMAGIMDPCILGIAKNTEDSFYLLVHPIPTHPGWHDGTFINTQYNMLISSKELISMKGKDIMQSLSEDNDLSKRQLYQRLKAMGDCCSVKKKYDVYLAMSRYVDNKHLTDLTLILKTLEITTKQTNLLKTFILEIKNYMARHKDFNFEAQLSRLFISIYDHDKNIAKYISKYLSKELKRCNKNLD